MNKDFREFSKEELATNVVNQFHDMVVRAEIDKRFFKLKEEQAPHNSEQRKVFENQIKLLVKKIEEIRSKYQSAKAYLEEVKREHA